MAIGLPQYASSTFNTCEDQPLPLMHSPPMRFMVNPDDVPLAHHNPIPVSLHWQDEVKAGLPRDVELGVLEPVPVGESVGNTSFGKHIIWETRHTQSPFHQARSVPSDKKKTMFDCWNGYHSVPLHPDDCHITTFITPWG